MIPPKDFTPQWRGGVASGLLATLLAVSSVFMLPNSAHARDSDQQRKFERLDAMVRSMSITRRWHVNRPTRKALINGAIDGMLRSVDAEAEYYSPEALKRLGGLANAHGPGLEIRREPAKRRLESPGYRVISSRDGSPAALAGLKAGDLISHINGKALTSQSHLDVLELISASVADGGNATLTVLSSGADEPSTVRLAAPRDDLATVDFAEPMTGIVWVRVAAVEREAASIIDVELRGAMRQLNVHLRGVVLDLRATAIGDGEGAAAIADLFLERGVILNVEQRQRRDGRRRMARGGDIIAGKALAVLIDDGTAGAAEALAAALVSNRRGRIIGLRSAGRGGIRTLEWLDRRGRKGAIRMTTSRFLKPDGKGIEGEGVAPDVVEVQTPKDPACRSLDITSTEGGGTCKRRTLDEDGQLRAAIAHLTATAAVKPPAAARSSNPIAPLAGTGVPASVKP